MTGPRPSRRDCLAFALAATAGAPLWAQARRHAVLSLVGDRFSVVSVSPSTGSQLDRNNRQDVLLPDNTLDREALLALDDQLRARDRSARPVLLAAGSSALYNGQESLFESGADSAATQALWATLGQADATHLVLVTRHRGDAQMRLSEGHAGSGRLAGLGFYIDRDMPVTDKESGRSGFGFIGTYAYVAVDLIDIGARKRIARAVAHEADVVPTYTSRDAVSPWDTMTAPQKAARLRDVMLRAVGKAGRELLGA